MKLDSENSKTAQTPEEATTVGQFLKFTRLSQKKSVETVAKDLCIRKIYIKAIEESDFKELPPIPYGVGFVRSYAEYLGLNNDRIAQCYKEEAMPKKTEEIQTPVIAAHTGVMIPNRKQILTGIAAVLALYLIWLMASCKPNPPAPEAVLETQAASTNEIAGDAPAAVQNEDTAIVEDNAENQIKIVEDSYFEEPQNNKEIKPAETEQKNAKAKPAQSETDSRIVVKFNGDSWFEIRDAQKVYISGIFQKGYVYNVPNVPGLIFSVGRYYNVDVYIDGQLTRVARPRRQTNIDLDKFLNH